jgi:hypothetical protein
MAAPELARLADRPEDYEHFGIDHPDRPAPMEIGLRTDLHNPHDYEWVYNHVMLDGGQGSLVVVFHTKPTRQVPGPLAPYVSVTLDRPLEGQHFERRIRVTPEDFDSSREDCAIQMSANSLQRLGPYTSTTSGTFRLHVEERDLAIDLDFSSRMPAWRPATGYFLFGDEGYFGWNVPMPCGLGWGRIAIAGQQLDVQAAPAYVDHNSGHRSPAELMSRWQWYHGIVGDWDWTKGVKSRHSFVLGPYAILGAQLSARPEFGGADLRTSMLALDSFGPVARGVGKLDIYEEYTDGGLFDYRGDRHDYYADFQQLHLIDSRLPDYQRLLGDVDLVHNSHNNADDMSWGVATSTGHCVMERMAFREGTV